jgi:hypothetical protein
MNPYVSVYSAKPALEAFLSAPIGVELNGMTLSVRSGLSRLGVDPWQEAARLSLLPKASAVVALNHCIDRLPLGAWQSSDTTGIALRLVELLPKHDSSKRADSIDPRRGRKARGASLVPWLLAASIAVFLLYSAFG